MLQEIEVDHRDIVSSRSFEEVVEAFEKAVGTVEDIGLPAISAASKDAADFEARVNERIGPSGFTRFLTIDHGAWLTFIGMPAKARMYTIGNPFIALTMLRHDLGAGLNVPVRLMIYQDRTAGKVRLVYDRPSSLMSNFRNSELIDAARKLDAKLDALAERVTG